MLLQPGLYIVSSPIGNLNDITLRALEVLRNSTLILCEDTRVSQILLAKHNIKTKLRIYNDHSTQKDRDLICSLISKGEIISLISDAGTPLICDPGFKLIRDLKKLDYYVDAIPGPTSLITALTLSGLPSDRFFFGGFIGRTSVAKSKIFYELSPLDATLIFFEAANRLIHTLEIAIKIFGDREASVARELTKLYQEVKTGKLSEIINFFKQKTLKGEIILLISGPSYNMHNEEKNSSIKLTEFILSQLQSNASCKTITNMAFKNFNNFYSKAEIYKLVNKLVKEKS